MVESFTPIAGKARVGSALAALGAALLLSACTASTPSAPIQTVPDRPVVGAPPPPAIRFPQAPGTPGSGPSRRVATHSFLHARYRFLSAAMRIRNALSLRQTMEETMKGTVLILGASGRFGRNAAEAFAQAGWQVRRFTRGGDLSDAANGADVIVNGWNPPYPRPVSYTHL